jgi:hypothetical protein
MRLSFSGKCGTLLTENMDERGVAEEELIERIAGSVAGRIGTPPQPQAQGERRYVREEEAAAFLGVSVSALRSWSSKRSRSGTRLKRAFSLMQSLSMPSSGNRIGCFDGRRPTTE